MNRKYLPLLLLLATALAVEVVLSVCAPVSVFGFELRDGGFAEVFAPRAEAQLCEQSASPLPSDTAAGNGGEAASGNDKNSDKYRILFIRKCTA